MRVLTYCYLTCQVIETNQEGDEVIVQKQVYTTKDKMLDLTTSFLNNLDGADGSAWVSDTNECGGGIFANLFD